MMTTIVLSGPMARKFGREHKRDLDLPSVGEAMKALMNTVDGFREHMNKNRDKGFHVFVDNRNLGEAELHEVVPGSVIRITPAIKGAKNGGVFQIILGAVLIVAGVLVTGLSYGWAAPVGNAMIGMGTAMVLGGVVQLIAAPQAETKDKPENTPSYIFSGPVNTVAQGRPVPVLYGELEVGSAVISAGITVDQTLGSYTDDGGDYEDEGNGRHLRDPFKLTTREAML